jgi:hypothetical protein
LRLEEVEAIFAANDFSATLAEGRTQGMVTQKLVKCLDQSGPITGRDQEAIHFIVYQVR